MLAASGGHPRAMRTLVIRAHVNALRLVAAGHALDRWPTRDTRNWGCAGLTSLAHRRTVRGQRGAHLQLHGPRDVGSWARSVRRSACFDSARCTCRAPASSISMVDTESTEGMLDLERGRFRQADGVAAFVWPSTRPRARGDYSHTGAATRGRACCGMPRHCTRPTSSKPVQRLAARLPAALEARDVGLLRPHDRAKPRGCARACCSGTATWTAPFHACSLNWNTLGHLESCPASSPRAKLERMRMLMRQGQCPRRRARSWIAPTTPKCGKESRASACPRTMSTGHEHRAGCAGKSSSAMRPARWRCTALTAILAGRLEAEARMRRSAQAAHASRNWHCGGCSCDDGGGRRGLSPGVGRRRARSARHAPDPGRGTARRPRPCINMVLQRLSSRPR